MIDFFIESYKQYCQNNHIKYNYQTAIKEFIKFANHINRLGEEYFNSPYFQGVDFNEIKRNN